MKAFVTGGTGFIGRALVRRLVERGDEVVALARSEESAAALSALGARPASGDITEPERLREAMAGAEVVFHIAAWYKLGARDWRQAERINVDGTQNVLTTAWEAGVPKIIYTSTLAVFGDTRGVLVDETYRMPSDQEFLTEYDRTKWLAHYGVALPLIEKGAPVIILMPGVVFGPGDQSLVGEMMYRYYWRQLPFPFLPGPELRLTFAHVNDIVDAHLLAAEKGAPGESYITAGPAASMGESVSLWSEITGRPKPLLSIPARFVKPSAPILGLIGKVLPLSQLFSQDGAKILEASYIARADKAARELGWQPRPLRDGLQETFQWISMHPPQPSRLSGTPAGRRKLAGLALGVGVGLLVLWLVNRRR